MKQKTIWVVLLILALAVSFTIPANAAPNYSTTRIRFQSGATSAVVLGSLAPHQAQDYVLRATAGQLMQVSLRANNTAQLAIWSANGTALLADNTAQGWQGKLPNSGDNRIRVTSLDQNSSYCLRTTVFARIQFTPGKTSTQVSSPVQRCKNQNTEAVGGYVLRAQAGQKMDVVIDSPNRRTFLTITGADGKSLKVYDDWQTAWLGVIPTTQDYYFQPVAVGPDSQFTIKIVIPPLGHTTPNRIRFAPGAESATVNGRLLPGVNTRYVLWAARGQRMELRVWPTPTTNPPPVVTIIVSAPNQQKWRLSQQGVIEPLPVSGDFTITLRLDPGASATNYTMEVRIPAG